jgi:hypothetical protein
MTATAAAVAETFDPAATAGLPEPARRWLSHAIAPGRRCGAPFGRYLFGVRVEITGAAFS